MALRITAAILLVLAGALAAQTWTATGLPRGLALDPKTGVIAGNPKDSGSFTFNACATDATNVTACRDFTLVVKPTIMVEAVTLTPMDIGGRFQLQLRATIVTSVP